MNTISNIFFLYLRQFSSVLSGVCTLHFREHASKTPRTAVEYGSQTLECIRITWTLV